MNELNCLKRFEIYTQADQHFFTQIIKEMRDYKNWPVDTITNAVFYLTGSESSKGLLEMAPQVFQDEIVETIYSENCSLPDCDYIIQIHYLPGVTDNIAKSSMEAFTLLGLDVQVASGQLYFIKLNGTMDIANLTQMASSYFGNPLIQNVQIFTKEEFLKIDRFNNISLPIVKMQHDHHVDTIDLDISESQFDVLNKERCLALTYNEFLHIKKHYDDTGIEKIRKSYGLSKWPTDVELEVIAQTWSEHCKHKIFGAHIDYTETIDSSIKQLGNFEVSSLYKTFIKGATKEVEEEYKIPWLKSVFSDNAGIVRFDKNIDLCIKAETHNSPSALDPYGGALTGILGVNRDILGCGMGAKPIANTDVFCLASSTWPESGQESKMPQGLMEPIQLLKGVHKGVEDGGNKSGIPTVNGAIFFDQDYAGKPLVFCGTVGVLPPFLKDGRETALKVPNIGDYIVMVGGHIGSDGIHGATFSSLELNEDSPATAVQIGDPITQKRVIDFIIEARDLGLYSSITDNGAGGLSSSVGEMATMTNGAWIDLEKCPLKYPGLSPWEIFISESQERMTLAVPPENWSEFSSLSKRRNVDSVILGEFDNSGNLEIRLADKTVALLDLYFLHESLPQMQLKAIYDGTRERDTWINIDKRIDRPKLLDKEFIEHTLLTLLNCENIASKEYWVRQYDHEVQGATHIKPYGGPKGQAPSDSGVILLSSHGGEEDNAISIGCGIAPRMSLVDPYLMALYSVDEAVRNVVSTGGDIEHLCLLDNFCWPDPVLSEKTPDGDYKLGQLVRTCRGLYDICKSYGLPLVSGKDSMKNDFRGKNREGDDLVISILPTLLVTAMAKTNTSATTNSYFKEAGDLIYSIRGASKNLAGSEYSQHIKNIKISLDYPDLGKTRQTYLDLNKAMNKGLLQSCHDISDGGLIVAVVESSMGGELGFEVDIVSKDLENELFAEGLCQFVVTIKKENQQAFETIFPESQNLGIVTKNDQLTMKYENNLIMDLPMAKCLKAYNREWIH